MYIDPPLEDMIDFDGDRQIFEGAIPVSYGMDFLEVRLDPGLRGRSLRLEFLGAGEISQFGVQVWQIGPGVMKPRAITARPEVVAQTPDGTHVYVLARVDTMVFDRLAVIIVRLDPDEMGNPEGTYGMVLDSTS